MLIISIILLLLVIIITIIVKRKPEYGNIAKKSLMILVVLAVLNFSLKNIRFKQSYDDCDILSSIDDLVVALEDLRKKVELKKI